MNNSFTRIAAKNFRGFQAASFSFEDTAKSNKPFVIIYGPNGSGKTSLARLFGVLPSLTFMVDSRLAFTELFSDYPLPKGDLDSVQGLVKSQIITSVRDIIDENKTIGSENEPMELEYHFRLGERSGQYRIVFSDEKCVEESLSFRLDARIETIFDSNGSSLRLNEKVFLNSAVRSSIKEEHSRLFGSTSLLGIIHHFVTSSNDEYRNKNIRSELLDILSFFSSLSVSVSGVSRGLMVGNKDEKEVFHDLQNQRVTEASERLRPALELGLTAFFSSLSYNLKSIEYRKVLHDNNEVYSLYFNEYHGDDVVRSVPLEKLSSGTRKIMSIFFALYHAFLGRTTIIDEVDNGIHDLIVANILSSASGNEMGQLIFTTHNTLLMKKLPKSSICFLDEGPHNETSFYSLGAFGRKVQEKTDVVGRYLDGLYGGAPFPNVPSMRVIKQMMDEEYHKQSSGGTPHE